MKGLFFILQSVQLLSSPDNPDEGTDLVDDDPTMKQILVGYIVPEALFFWGAYI